MNARTAVTLSALAYEGDIVAALARSLPSWRVVWLADHAVDDNMAFIATNDLGEYALAIRGTLMQFEVQNVENWIEDLDVLEQVPWPPTNPSSKLSRGAHTGLSGLQQLVDSRSDAAVGLRDFLFNVAAESPVNMTVTGHSLGGTLATVFAVWMHDEFVRVGLLPRISVWTFAAPAAGNAEFATRYDTIFADRSFRFVMDFDVVPTFPVPDEMLAMVRTYFDNANHDEMMRIADVALQGCARSIQASELLHRSRYAQTNTPTGCVRVDDSVAPKPPISTVRAWIQAVASRHSVDHYVQAVASSAPSEHVTP